MTIAQAFNEITIAQGGTPSTGGTITGAIDALNDTLAGSDQQPAQTIEGAIRLLGAHIGGGGGSVSLGGLQLVDTGKMPTPVFLDKDGDQFVCTVASSLGDNLPGLVAAGTFVGAPEGYIPSVYAVADQSYVKDLAEVGSATVTIMGQTVEYAVYAVEDVTAANYIYLAED